MDNFFDLLPQVLASGITSGVMYGFVAVGFTIVFNSSDVINFAQGDFVIAGAFIYIGLDSVTHNVALAAIGAVIAGGLIGGGTYHGLIRRARGASVMSLLILTLGVSVAIQGLLLVIVGPNAQSAAAFSSGPSILLFNAYITRQAIWIVGMLLVVSAALGYFFTRTTLGIKMLACAIDRRAAALMGIDVRRMVLMSWVVSGALASLAGVLVTPLISASYDGGLAVALNGFAAAVLSGMGRVGGAFVGGLVVGIANAMAAGYLPQNLLGFQSVAGVVLMLAVLMVRPSGLFGGRAEARHTLTS